MKVDDDIDKLAKSFEHLSKSLDELRSACPWNAKQTIQSLRYLTVEEVYELSEAIAVVNDRPESECALNDLKKELSDILLHLFFYAKIAYDNGWFGMSDIADAATQKMIDRHPHIFPIDGKLESSPISWEKVKMREGRRSVLEGVPQSLPPLVKAVRMQEKAEGVGYIDSMVDVNASPVMSDAVLSGDEQQFGDALLSLLHIAHSKGINVDNALLYANKRYQQRFEAWEKDRQKECNN